MATPKKLPKPGARERVTRNTLNPTPKITGSAIPNNKILISILETFQSQLWERQKHSCGI
jgi:hypothetical protein